MSRFQTLTLSGGGYRGLFTARFIASCEEGFSTKCCNHFKLIAGTSIGALLAAGLAAGVPAETLASKMKEHGLEIFPRNTFTRTKRFLFTAPYNPERIREAIRAILKDDAEVPLDQFNGPLVITSVNYSSGRTEVFRSKGIAGAQASKVKIEDAILASAAAPTFFPTHKIEPSGEYIDGGLVANAPDMVAICDAIDYFNENSETIYQLSIGTASRQEGGNICDTSRASSALSWIVLHGLVQSIMAAQEDLALSQAKTLLRNNFLRVDREPAQQHVKEIKFLDQADKTATAILESLAADAWEELRNNEQLKDFFR